MSAILYNIKRFVLLISVIFLFDSCDSGKNEIYGQLLDLEGNPIENSHVKIRVPNEDVKNDSLTSSLLQTVLTDKQGNFKIDAPYEGAAILDFTAPLHENKSLPVYFLNDSKLHLKIQLAPITKKEDLSELAVVGNFNDYDKSKSVPMTLNDNGIYTCEIEYSGDQLEYQLVNYTADMEFINAKYPGLNSCNPSEAKTTITSDGTYVSVAKLKDGKAIIEVDPKILDTKERDGVWTLVESSGNTKMFSDLVKSFENDVELYIKDRIRVKNGFDKEDEIGALRKKHDWSKIKNTINDVLENEDVETELKQAVLAYYTQSIGSLGEMFYNALDTDLGVKALELIEPTSSIWTLFEGVNNLRWSHQHNPIRNFEPYFDELVNNHSNSMLIQGVLLYDVKVSLYEEDFDRVKTHTNILINNYPESAAAKEAAKFSGIKNEVTTIPSFSISDIDDPNKIYSDESLKGSYYLIDFWGTWCVPCIAEMPYLHQAYEKYQGQEFEILSLAWDKSPEAVQKFRAKRWNMPWSNAWIEGYSSRERDENELLRKFNVNGFPTTLFIDPDGNVIAKGGALRGSRLDETLSKYLK